jgi:hypothetical protein
MSNLSELLPAGGAAKEFEPVASGTLPNGQAVVLKADGTVEAVSGTTVADATGTATIFENANMINGASYDGTALTTLTSTKVLAVYQDVANSNRGTACVLDISGMSITAGTPVVFESASVEDTQSVDKLTSTKAIVGYRHGGNGYATARILTISGTSISIGTATVIKSDGSYHLTIRALSDIKAIVFWSNWSDGNKALIKTLDVSGTAITARNEYNINTADTRAMSMVVLSPTKVMTLYKDIDASGAGYIKISTINGQVITSGSSVQLSAGSAYRHSLCKLTETSALCVYWGASGGGYPQARVITATGTTPVLEAVTTWGEGSGFGTCSSAALSSTKAIFTYRDPNNSSAGTSVVINISGTTVTVETPIQHYTASSYDKPSVASLGNNKSVVSYQITNTRGEARVIQSNLVVTNVSSFVGITAEAIADTATGKVNAKGGVASSVANIAPLINFSTPTEFNNGNTEYIEIAFDPNNANKCVICYRDAAQSGYGKAIVGTVSGTSISFDTMEAHFNAGSTNRPSLAWDPDNSGKLVIAYADLGNSGQGTAVVGTVSGTSISFGSQVVFCSGETQQTAITFNSSNTCVITYRNEGNSNYGEGIVGTVSGTSISFGTASVFNSASTGTNQVAADPNTANTVVVAYSNGATNPATGGAAVGTVSGTSISWGSEQQFTSTETEYVRMAFDPNNAGKFVIMWRDGAGSDGATIVGNVSGTSITYGAKTLFLAGANQSANNIAFDTNKANSIILSYNYSNGGKVVEGTITGNAIAYGTTFSYANTTGHNWVAIDPSAAGKFALAYQDGSDSSKGKVIMGQSSEALTTGSDYYLQADGTVSTATASPAINIGRAISPTSLILR